MIDETRPGKCCGSFMGCGDSDPYFGIQFKVAVALAVLVIVGVMFI